MKKILLILIIGMFCFSLASAELNPCGNTNSFLGSFKQGEPVDLKQTCDTCTYVNLSKVNYPDSSFVYYEGEMTKNGIDYNYTITDTYTLGCYSYTVHGDKDGSTKAEVIYFKITPSGNSGNENSIFFIFVIILLYVVTFVSFFGRNIPLTILSGMAMTGLGIYIINNGIIVFRDWLTNYVAYVTIAIGAIVALWAVLEELDIF